MSSPSGPNTAAPTAPTCWHSPRSTGLATMTATKKERDMPLSLVDHHRSPVSPFARLPLDVVHIVFLYCLPADHNPYICATEPPMVLTHVCRRWREVAFEVPLIWANIHVHIPFYPDMSVRDGPQSEYHVRPNSVDELQGQDRASYLRDVAYWKFKMRDLKRMVIRWLARAKGCSISLSLSQFTNVFDDANQGCDEVNEVVAVLLSCCSQWKSVELYASSPIIAQFLAVPTQHAPTLQRISIKWQTPMERNLHRGTSKLVLASPEGLMTVPELKSLSLQILPRDIMSLPVRWEGLTELIFDEYFAGFDSESLRRRFLPSDALGLLTLCPRLKRCRLAIGRGRVIGSIPAIPTLPLNDHNSSLSSGQTPVRKLIPLPWLEHLAIDEGVPLGDFFLCLHLPSLKEVVFSTALTPCEEEVPVSHPQYQHQVLSQQSGPMPGVSGVSGHISHLQPHGSTSRYASTSTSPLLDLLSQYGRSLEKLTFDEAGLSLQDIERALELVPNLTHLTMNRKSMMRSSSGGLTLGTERRKAAPGYLSKGLLERLTPRSAGPRGFKRRNGVSAIIANAAATCLCPRLVSFSCKLPASIQMQGTLIEFIKWRRYPWALDRASSSPALLQKCTINFSSSAWNAGQNLRDLKDISKELSRMTVDMHEFDLNIIYPNTPHFDLPIPRSSGATTSGARGATSKFSGRSGMASLMSQFVPRCRATSAGMYGYGSWYATGGGGELRDAWFEAW